VCNRALSAPLSVWGDHSDAMAVRDTSWIQVFCQNGQEAFDLTLWAFRVGEDSKVLFPVMVHFITRDRAGNFTGAKRGG
jgi:pyruvate ferredoxin oxidoreductase alpha subunit